MVKSIFLLSVIFLISYGTSSAQWVQVSNGLEAYSSTVLYNKDSKIYAGNYSGFSVSDNGGVKWKDIPQVEMYVQSIFAEENNLFAGGNGLMVSTDYGYNFTQVLNPFVTVTGIKRSGPNIIAAANGNGIYFSGDNPLIWAQRGIFNSVCRNIIVKGDFVFAGCLGQLKSNNGGVFKSSDHGDTWTETPLANTNVEFIAATSSTIIAGNRDELFKSSDNGQTWTAFALPSKGAVINVITLDEILYVNLQYDQVKKTYVSSDNGLTWNEFSLGGMLVSLIKKQNDLIASIEYKGISISHDQGITWESYLHKDVTVRSLYKKGTRLFAGTTNYGIYYSDDSGENWKLTNLSGVSGNEFSSSDSVMFVSTDESGVHRSYDNGLTWEHTGLGRVNGVHFFNSRLFADDSYAGIRYSTDEGNTWGARAVDGSVTYCFTDRNDKLYAGFFSQGIYYSNNSGDSWIQSGLTAGSVTQMGYNSQYLFCSSLSQPGILRSQDEGLTWEQTDLNKVCWCLLVSGNVVVAGTGSYGVYVSVDNGSAWRSRNESLPTNNVHSLIEYNGNVFAGLYDNGIYKTPMSYLTGVIQTGYSVPERFDLHQNYPNPFNPVTNLEFQISNLGFVSLKVFDASGKEVATLINEMKQPGYYTASFDGSNFSSGVYFYRMEAGGFVQTKKMLLLK